MIKSSLVESESDDDLLCDLVGMQEEPAAKKKRPILSTHDADRKLAEEM